MPAFGDFNAETSLSSSTSSAKVASRATPDFAGTVTSLTCLLKMLSGTTTAAAVIYADSAGSPGSLLAVSDTQTISGSTLTPYAFTFSGANQISLVAGTPYWIGVWWDTPSGSGTIEWGRGSTASKIDKASDTSGGPASTFGTVSALSGPLGAYVTYDVTGLSDAYPENHYASGDGLDDSAEHSDVGQSFTAGHTANITSAKFYVAKLGSPTGNAVANLWAHSGTFGTSSQGTGTPLAVSDPVDISTLSSSHALATFNFSTPFGLTAGTHYVITCNFTGGDASNKLEVGKGTDLAHPGNEASKSSGTWSHNAFDDVCFYVYDDSTAGGGGGATVTPGVASLSLTTFAPTIAVSNNKKVTPGVASLSLNSFAPKLKLAVIPAVAALSLTTFAPTVHVSNNKTVTPSTASLSLTTHAPTVLITNNKKVVPGTASLTLTGHAPILVTTVKPGTASLVITTHAPTVSIANNRTVIPGVASLTLTGHAPTLKLAVIPSTRALSITTHAPTVSVSAPKTVIPGSATLTITSQAPIVLTPRIVIPGVAHLTLTTHAPAVALPKRVIPGTRSLVITTFAPTLKRPISVVPGSSSLQLTTYAPRVILPAFFNQAAIELSSTTPAASDSSSISSVGISSSAIVETMTGSNGNLAAQGQQTDAELGADNNQVTI